MNGMTPVARSTWGATAPLGPRMTLPVGEVWLHHSVTAATGDPYADARTIERIGVSRFGRFSYSYIVHPSGVAMVGAGDTIGAHTAGRNSTSLAVCWIGNYEIDQPTRAQIESTAGLIRWLMNTGRLRDGVYPTGGHRDLKATACPGKNAYAALGDIRSLTSTEDYVGISDQQTADLIRDVKFVGKMVDSILRGNFGEKDGHLAGDLSWLEQHVRKVVREELSQNVTLPAGGLTAQQIIEAVKTALREGVE